MSATLADTIQTRGEAILRAIFFWETDEKQLGLIVRGFHYSLVYSAVIMYVLIHIFYPSYWNLLIYFIFYSFVFFHHIICGGCMVTRMEQRLLKDHKCVTDPLLELFKITTTPESSDAIFILLSAFVMFFLTCEIICRSLLKFTDWFS
uniref:Uncharacterized protein n=1 Tax=viral metagenome TaxID=1070528 RepID=A0A6C0KVV8_9ZZZZ